MSWARIGTPQPPEGDGMVTATPGLMLGILTADCAPVLFADAEAGVIGAAHAGWKGALGGVLEATVAAMEGLGARRANIAAAIGPCITQANYEVGAEFRDRFLAQDARNRGFFAPRAGQAITASTWRVMPPTGWRRRGSAISPNWGFAPIRRKTAFSRSAAPPIAARPIMGGKFR